MSDDAGESAGDAVAPFRHAPSAASAATARDAFCAADVASAATAAALRLPASAHVAKLTAAPSPPVCERIAAVHRLNERFAACTTHEAACNLAAELCTPACCTALVQLLVDGDCLVELAVLLMHQICLLHAGGAGALADAGALPVLAATLRADEPLIRAHGLPLLVAFAERSEMAPRLVRAGVVRLLCFLAKLRPAAAPGPGGDEPAPPAVAGVGAHWPLLLEVSDGLLRVPGALPEAQRQKLRDAFAEAAIAHKKGALPLEQHDVRRLTRLLRHLRALALCESAPPSRTLRGVTTGQAQGHARASGSSAKVQ